MEYSLLVSAYFFVLASRTFRVKIQFKMGCSSSNPSICFCGFDSSNGTLKSFQDYCTYGPNDGCCYTIGSNFAKWGYEYKDYNCKLPDAEMLKKNPEKCSPISTWAPNCAKDSINEEVKSMDKFCNSGSEDKSCCFLVGLNYNDYDLKEFERGCKIVNKSLDQIQLSKCGYPTSWVPNCVNDSKNENALAKDKICTSGSEKAPCCFKLGNNYNKYGFTEYETGCQIINETLGLEQLKQCGLGKVSSWRDPILNGTTCYTTSVGTNITSNVTYTKHSSSLGNDFICLNYVTWLEAKKQYIVIASTGTIELFGNMSKLPDVYMNLSKCDTPLCNDPYQLQMKLETFEPEASILTETGSSFSCFKGIYPNVNQHIFYNAQSCVRYSYRPSYGSSYLIVYDGLPKNLLGSLTNTTIFKNVFTCNTPNCNTIVIPSSSNPSTSSVLPNNSGNINCFVPVDSSNIVIPHPNPFSVDSHKFCIKFKSTASNTSMYSSVSSYDAFTSYSQISDLTVCNTSLCNSPSSSAANLKCYLSDVKDPSNINKYSSNLPVDSCVKYSIGEITYYSGVTSATLAIINGNPSLFKSVSSCSSDYCLTP